MTRRSSMRSRRLSSRVRRRSNRCPNRPRSSSLPCRDWELPGGRASDAVTA
jgi:hypothetical protein